MKRVAILDRANRPASALLLTVMIIAILTTTTLASIAVRFDQLAATDKIANSAVAKSAADSGLVKLKEKLATASVADTVFDLDNNTESTPIPTPYRPNPRKIVSTYQKVQTTLPRCNGVIVLAPWANDGQYLLNQSNDSNPALIFNYANIVNDTPLGIIPGNGDLGGAGNTPEKQKTISQLTNMGHFYNPFAPLGAKQKDLNYWVVKLGGPQDQFLTRKAVDGVSSYYRNVDFVYLPYLPRWSDSGLFSATPGTGVDRYSAIALRQRFESVIKENNFKVWLDASISDAQLYQYGFGDLFVDSSDYRLKWLQPSLWNDTPEADNLSTPYKTDNAEATTLIWAKKNQPLMTSADNNWKVAIVKGAKSFSFIKLANTNLSFTAGRTITGLIYGSLEGIRLNQPLTLVLLDRNQQPLVLQDRGQDQGRLYNVMFTKIGPITTSNGVESISVDFKLGDGPTINNINYSTPPKPSGADVAGSDVDTIAVLASAHFSTPNSINSVNISVLSGNSATISRSGQNCQPDCPAVGDLVSLTKPSAPTTAPVWGKVTSVSYPDGSSFDSFTVDKLRQSPLPTREMAYTLFDQGGSKIAYYGGAVAMNDYDGGYASESDQLWIYDPEADSWVFKAPNGTSPGRRAGASMVYDSTNNRLVMIGGYYHEAINISGQGDCETTSQLSCLYTDRPGLRIAKRVTNDVYAYSLGSSTWERISYAFAPAQKIQNNVPYIARVTSTLANRSGLERWNLTAKNPENADQTLQVDGNPSTITVFPSAAGVAKGDEVYLYGNKRSDGKNFYIWGRVSSVDYAGNRVTLTTYGYQGNNAPVTMKSLAMQVVKRQLATSPCSGVVNDPLSYCLLADSTGYAVGDSVVLEQYGANSLDNTLSGFISFIDSGGQVYFVADEKSAEPTIKDYSVASAGKVANESAVAFPSARYGATFALQPLSPTKAAYWEGTARNLNSNNRFADLWNVQFNAGSGPASAVWSFQPTDNTVDPSFNSNDYNFQVIQPSYSYQIATTSNSDSTVVKDKDHRTQAGVKIWDDSKHWQLDVDPNDAGKVVVGAWATLERRLNTDGSRETFHGIVENTYSSAPSGCSAYSDGSKLCLKHNPAYPNDSGLAGDSKNVKVTMLPSFRTDLASGGTFKGYADHVSLQNVPNDTIPGVGALVMIWRAPTNPNDFPVNAYTFSVNSRTYVGNRTFNLYFDKLTASPHPLGYSTSQIASDGTTDRLLTVTDHQMNYYDSTVGAPEWVKDTTNSSWKIRLAAPNPNLLYRPAPRRGAMTASLYDSLSSKLFVVGGTFGEYGSLWKQSNAGATATNGASWTAQYSSANLADDIPNLFGGSLVVYKSGSVIKAVYFGGKQKTDQSSADYGSLIGAKMLGRPDNGPGTQADNSFYVVDNSVANDPTAVAFTNTIESNAANWPNGVASSLEFQGSNRGDNKSVCAYLGQSNCSSKELLSQLGNLGRLDNSSTNKVYNGWSWGSSAILTDLGSGFKSRSSKASLIISASTLSGSGVNGRWEQDGYRPYRCDKTGSIGCNTTAYGQLATDYGDKTAGLAAYSAVGNATDKGGAILATSVGVGAAIASSRGGSNDSTDRWYSYCAASDLKKTGGVPDLSNGSYICDSSATRYLPSLPDAEDLLFTLNATQALGATDTYKVVGYYGGIKRGYLVTSTSGTLPKIVEIVP